MKMVAVTQRVAVVPDYGERRDCLDQAWTKFLNICGLLPLLLPNHTETALALCEKADIAGVVLTGGNDLAVCGGEAPERDAVELALLEWAGRRAMPLLGVCRGMQMIQHFFGVALRRVEGHIAPHTVICTGGERRKVNSFHRFAAFDSRSPLDVWAVAADGAIEAVRHSPRLITGMMWHPERCIPFSADDVALFRQLFGVD